ncbi:hypothetical protein HY995_04055 [Candidatus Micrarchaeota archaeon]|nr:hypothetical protein [Candidatus Micrarchaeota archaeon]MBI5177231.1 hypothetical protein [Candidatus Micrarchaeota archaeon]
MEKSKATNWRDCIEFIVKEFAEKEKRQDEVLQLSRQIIRESASAIKDIHTGNIAGAKEGLTRIGGLAAHMREIDHGLENISFQCYQEFVEISSLLAVYEHREFPTHEELKVTPVAYLNGLADCSGELRRALQNSLLAGKKKQAEYYFGKMNELYDNLMLVKFSSSLVGPLKHKQDVLRGQLEAARSEMLRK